MATRHASPADSCDPRVAVVIPCYRVASHVIDVISRIGPEVWRIYCVDDGCPEETGRHVEERVGDDRVRVLYNQRNLGVGGAMKTGYRQALADGADVVVKIDGDGQMAPELLPDFVGPILSGSADYCKGNRFFNLEDLKGMPASRLAGNAVLSFLCKLSSGYWNLFDPANGYTAVHASVLAELPFSKIADGYFFESDMLFRLGVLRAVVVDVPMRSSYGDEVSSLSIPRVVGPFFLGHLRNFFKRLGYNYFLRGFSAASVEMILGVPLVVFGAAFGIAHWVHSSRSGELASAGTVMLGALPIIVGFQFLLNAVAEDIRSVPRVPMYLRLSRRRSKTGESSPRFPPDV